MGLFKSDFKIVADYFVQMRKNRDYQPSQETMRHVDEVLKLLAILTQDDRFEDAVNQEQKKGKVKTMCEALDRAEARGRESAMLQAIRSLMKTMKWTAEQAMEMLKVPEAERAKYAGMIKGK